MWKPRNLGLWAVVATTVLTTTLPSGSAAAKTAHVRDPRDAPANVDITSVIYRNQETSAGVTVHARDLQRTGTLVTVIAVPESDFSYEATVSVHSDGSLDKRLELVTPGTRRQRPCAMVAAWSPRTNAVALSVPHRCLRFGRFLSRHFMQATLIVSGSRDEARGVDVGRGDSPGCATAAEIRSLHRGYPKARVHAILDTAGRFGHGAAGGYSRVYQSCSGGKPWFVEYRGTTDRLVGTGRVE
jgi:hypothetical protein